MVPMIWALALVALFTASDAQSAEVRRGQGGEPLTGHVLVVARSEAYLSDTVVTSVVVMVESYGLTTEVVLQDVLVSDFDYGPFDIVALTWGANPADVTALATASEVGSVGIAVTSRQASEVGSLDAHWLFGAGSVYGNDQEFTNLAITDAEHDITTGFSESVQFYSSIQYGSYMSSTNSDECRVLATGGEGPALVVHTTHKRVLVPFYGHSPSVGRMTAEGEELMRRSYEWLLPNTTTPTSTTSADLRSALEDLWQLLADEVTTTTTTVTMSTAVASTTVAPTSTTTAPQPRTLRTRAWITPATTTTTTTTAPQWLPTTLRPYLDRGFSSWDEGDDDGAPRVVISAGACLCAVAAAAFA